MRRKTNLLLIIALIIIGIIILHNINPDLFAVPKATNKISYTILRDIDSIPIKCPYSKLKPFHYGEA